MATVILCNPMGFDVTDFINNTAFVPQLMKGTIVQPGDTLYTLPYNNTIGLSNLEEGAELLNAKLTSTSGTIRVFSYSEGCQVADLWMSTYGKNSPVTPTSRLSFLSIANSDRKYGGLVYNRSGLSALCYTGGIGSTVPYAYQDFARQYDGWADAPTDSTISAAFNNAVAALSSFDAIPAALASVSQILQDTSEWDAVQNDYFGMSLIHENYFNVTVNDTSNAWYTDSSTGVQYGLALTYPVPMLGVGGAFASADQALRTAIEACYSRPMTPVAPNYSLATGGAATATSFGEPLGQVTWAINDPTLTTPWVAIPN